jgi:hypothetical protein
MTDIEILKQLLEGNHLPKKYISRAKELIHQLQTELKLWYD